MNKQMYASLAVIVVIALASIAAYAIKTGNESSVDLSDSTAPGNTASLPVTSVPSTNNERSPIGEPVNITGTIECIPPVADGSGIRAMSCAMGIKDDSGKYYGLHNPDPTKLMDLPTGQRTLISGTLAPATAKQSNIVGIINISTILKL